MPWTAADAERHTHQLRSEKQKRVWADVANSVLKRTGNEGRAVRTANGVAKRGGKRPKQARTSGRY